MMTKLLVPELSSTDDSQNAAQANAKKVNKTGIPDNLKASIEYMSGYSLDHVRVHYNSDKPALMEAHAYTDGHDIYLASGAEEYLAHELWHIVQQMRNEVQETVQLKAKVAGNDNKGLERKADVNGDEANKLAQKGDIVQLKSLKKGSGQGVVQQKALSNSKLNVAGENHLESQIDYKDKTGKIVNRRDLEKEMTTDQAGGDYWEENELTIISGDAPVEADPVVYRLLHTLQLIARLCKYVAKASNSDGAISITKQILDESSVPNFITLAEQQWLKVRGSNYPGDLSPDKIATRDGLLEERMLKMRALHAGLVAIKAEGENEAVDKQIVMGAVGQAKIYVDHMAKTMTIPELTKLRSEYMHKTAVEKEDDNGVWKIGDDHVKDIVALLDGTEPTYNLLTKDEFDEQLNEKFGDEYKPVEENE